MKKISVLWICLFLIFSYGTLVPIQTVSAGSLPPPDDGIDGLQYIDGDWNVTGTESYTNETIVLTGNLTIMPGGSLTFFNTTLKMNCSANGTYHINVTSGGSFYIYDLDNDNTTTEDASVITSNYSDGMHRFHFWVKRDANFTMINSELHECGEKYVSNDKLGLYIEANNSIVQHSLFSDNEFGMFIVASNLTISNNTIENNTWGGLWVYQTSNVTVENCLFRWNPNSAALEIRSSSDVIATDNILYENGNTIDIEYSSNITIKNNTLFSSLEDGMYIVMSSDVVIRDSTIQNQLYGIVLTVIAGPIFLINSSISGSSGLDIDITSDSQMIALNSSFNKSKVGFLGSGSTLTHQWFLHTYVNDTFGNPIPGATVRVRDNTNNTFDENYTTDTDGWARWIIVTERMQNTSGNVYYTPHNIMVTKDGYKNGNAEVNMNESKYITITLQEDVKPIADAGPDQSVNEDETVNFNGSGSSDNIGIEYYNWTFGDGSYDYGTNKTTNHTYTDAGSYIVTLNVSDAAGNWDKDTCLIFVNNVGPTADAGGDKTTSEGEAVIFDGSASTDTPSDQSDLIYTWYFGDGDSDTSMYVSHIYEDSGIYTATLVVTDDNGFVDSNSIIVTVNNVAPTIEPIDHQYIFENDVFRFYVNASDVPEDSLTYSDNSTLFVIDPVTGLIEFTPTNDDVGNHSVNITVVDDDGGVNYTIFNITVLNTNDAPVIESISQQSAVEDVEFTLQVNASDVDVGDVLTYSLTTSPTGMSINATTGLISWTPTNDDVGVHYVTVRVHDFASAFNEKSFRITVLNTNDPPEIVTASPLPYAFEDEYYITSILVVDIDVNETLYYSFDSAPDFLSIDRNTGIIFGTPTAEDIGFHNITVNITDSDDYVTKTLSLTVQNTNDAPVITSVPILLVEVGSEYAYEVVATDEDTEALTFSLDTAPEGMNIDSTTGRITWNPTTEHAGKSYNVVVSVSDGEEIVTQSFIVSVDDIIVHEPDNLWLPLLLGLIGGLIGAVVIIIIERKKEGQRRIEE